MSGEIVVVCESLKKVRTYVRSLHRLEIPDERIVVLTPESPLAGARRLAAGAAGLVLCGGPDIEPRRYGEKPRADAALALMPELDELEWRLLEGAQMASTPVWAMCRGMEIVNVFLGGTLWQDLALQVPGIQDHNPGGAVDQIAHALVDVDVDSHFGRTLARSEGVNSRHHQGVKRLAEPLTAVAWSPDRVLEAVELRGGDWWLQGVQWHPEDMPAAAVQRELWGQFGDRARAHSEAGTAAVGGRR